MRIVPRLLVLLPLLWVEGVWADAGETANQLAADFVGYDLTASPIYLNKTYVSAYGDNPKGLNPQALISGVDLLKLSFSAEGDGSVARNISLQRQGVDTDVFEWSINPWANELELAFTRGSGSYTRRSYRDGLNGNYTCFPFEFDEAELRQLEEFSELLSPQILLETFTLSISLRARFGGFWDIEETQRCAIIIPQEVIEAGWTGGPEILSEPQSFLRGEHYVRQYDGDLLSDYEEDDVEGQWLLPVFLEDPESAPGLASAAKLFPDRITFNLASGAGSRTALAERSGLLFEWSLSGGTLTLSNDRVVMRYRALDRQDDIFLFSFSYENTSTGLAFEYAWRGAKFDGSGANVVENIEVELPAYYQSLIDGEPSFIDADGTSENINGLLFYEPSKALRFVTNDYGDVPPFTSVGGEREVTKRGDTLVLTWAQVSPFDYFRQRFWTVVSSLANDRLLVIEKEDIQMSDRPRYEHIANRIIVVERMDLSRAGEAWLKSDFDNDGLTNSEEDEAGTSYGNPDSDADGLSDSEEVELGTDPNNVDSDGDGATDYEEVSDGTDPLDDGDPGQTGLPIWLLYQATQ